MVCGPAFRRAKISTQPRHTHKLIQSAGIIDVDGEGTLEYFWGRGTIYQPENP